MIARIAVGLCCGLAVSAQGASFEEAELTMSRLRTLSQALQMFRDESGRLPSTEEGVEALTRPSISGKGWRTPVVPEALVDAWDEPIIYRQPGVISVEAFDLYSKGANGLDEKGRGTTSAS